MTEIELMEKLKKSLSEYGTQAKLGKAIGVTQGYILDVLKGRRNIASPSILKFYGLTKVVSIK